MTRRGRPRGRWPTLRMQASVSSASKQRSRRANRSAERRSGMGPAISITRAIAQYHAASAPLATRWKSAAPMKGSWDGWWNSQSGGPGTRCCARQRAGRGGRAACALDDPARCLASCNARLVEVEVTRRGGSCGHLYSRRTRSHGATAHKRDGRNVRSWRRVRGRRLGRGGYAVGLWELYVMLQRALSRTQAASPAGTDALGPTPIRRSRARQQQTELMNAQAPILHINVRQPFHRPQRRRI